MRYDFLWNPVRENMRYFVRIYCSDEEWNVILKLWGGDEQGFKIESETSYNQFSQDSRYQEFCYPCLRFIETGFIMGHCNKSSPIIEERDRSNFE